jgi:hypothetical protein
MSRFNSRRFYGDPIDGSAFTNLPQSVLAYPVGTGSTPSLIYTEIIQASSLGLTSSYRTAIAIMGTRWNSSLPVLGAPLEASSDGCAVLHGSAFTNLPQSVPAYPVGTGSTPSLIYTEIIQASTDRAHKFLPNSNPNNGDDVEFVPTLVEPTGREQINGR